PIAHASIAIVAEPADAVVRVNGSPIDSREEISLPEAGAYELSVEKQGHRTWRKTFSPEEMQGHLRLYVNLSPEK
ncbi:MAG TPA: PEGA domain-containing protein, partial [Haliangium sp.]|nr:PEGA domain-containing protein [Haliangium sp.]